jgi:hypothetical protein
MSDMFSTVDRMRQRNAKVEADRKQIEEARAEENRRRMPTITRLIDSLRKEFPDVRVTYASENGITRGVKTEVGIKLSETLVGTWRKTK